MDICSKIRETDGWMDMLNLFLFLYLVLYQLLCNTMRTYCPATYCPAALLLAQCAHPLELCQLMCLHVWALAKLCSCKCLRPWQCISE